MKITCAVCLTSLMDKLLQHAVTTCFCLWMHCDEVEARHYHNSVMLGVCVVKCNKCHHEMLTYKKQKRKSVKRQPADN